MGLSRGSGEEASLNLTGCSLGWEDRTDTYGKDDKIVLARLGMVDSNLTVLASVVVDGVFAWEVKMQDKTIPPQFVEAASHANSAAAVRALVSLLHNRESCCGNPDVKFVPLVKSRKGNSWMLRVNSVSFSSIVLHSMSHPRDRCCCI